MRLSDGVLLFLLSLNKGDLVIDNNYEQLTKIANSISFQESEVNFELLCGLADAFDLGRTSLVDKQELIRLLKDSLTIKIEAEQNYNKTSLFKRFKIIILFDGEVISTNDCVL